MTYPRSGEYYVNGEALRRMPALPDSIANEIRDGEPSDIEAANDHLALVVYAFQRAKRLMPREYHTEV